MIILIALIFATNVVCQKSSSKESVEDAIAITSQNTTTLYPISNKTIINKDTKPETIEKIKDATSWKLETAYGESDAVKGEENSQESNEVNKTAEAIKEFKPSPHLGTFLDVDSFDITPTKPTFDDFRPLKKPPTGFISSHKDQFKSSLFYNDEYKYQNDFPYKIESNFFNKAKGNWHHPDLESRPTVEAPVKIPAGGLYRSPDPFKDKPVQSDDDFGLTFNDLKENNHVGAKKRVNPWKNLLQLATALIPVGLIVSALTPSIITVHSVDDAANPYSASVFRRSDSSIADLTSISESCRRRLLCELHSDNNYTQNNQIGRRKGRKCYRIRCEEPEALTKMLQWLLTHQRSPIKGHHFT